METSLCNGSRRLKSFFSFSCTTPDSGGKEFIVKTAFSDKWLLHWRQIRYSLFFSLNTIMYKFLSHRVLTLFFELCLFYLFLALLTYVFFTWSSLLHTFSFCWKCEPFIYFSFHFAFHPLPLFSRPSISEASTLRWNLSLANTFIMNSRSATQCNRNSLSSWCLHFFQILYFG
jgi:hypothetical protein